MKRETVLYTALILLYILFIFHANVSAQSVSPLITEIRYSSSLHTNKTNVPAFMNQSVSLNAENVTLQALLMNLENQADIKFSYRDETIEGQKRISAHFFKMPLHSVLYKIFDRMNVEYLPVKGRYVVLKKHRINIQQTSVISGVVTDGKTGATLPAANVALKGTQQGSSTNEEGRYEIQGVEPGTYTLVARFVGYQQVARQIVVQAGKNLSVDLKLIPSAINMDELVVVGYGQQKKSNITGAISTVHGEEITKVSSSGFQETLKGRIAGVNVTPSTGAPGAAMDINIRGLATFGNGNPLFVIDGVPVFNSSGGTINPLATLNPGNIESVEVLKDASAAAIYGARAANGVIIITTKKGQAGKTQVQFEASGGVATVTKTIPMMNSEQYVQYVRDSYQNAGFPLPISVQEPLLSENLKTDTDWSDAAFSPAAQQNYSLMVSGGNENGTYSFGGGYLNQGGNLPNGNFKRYSARINSDFNIGEKFTIGESLELSRGVWAGTISPTTANFQQLLQQAPTVPVYNPENLGGFAGPTVERTPENRVNSIGVWTLTDDNMTRNRALGRLYADYEFLPGLSYRLNIGGDFSYDQSKTFVPKYEMGNRSNPVADLNEGWTTVNTYLIENTLTYQHTFNGVHDVTLLAGYTQQNSWVKNVGGSIQDFPSNDTRTIAAGFGQSSLNGDETGWALRSEIGRLNYTYKDKYNLMVAVRRDGSSRFGKNNRYGIFPSASASWLISDESFMANINAISNLKLRASWGKVGSQSIDNFAAIATISPYARYILGESQSLAPGATYLSLGNPNLRWESTTQTDIGLDIGFFDNRLSFEMDYYIKDTDDVLLRVPIPTTSGIRRDNGPFQNAGSLRNTGFEFTANYQNSIGDLDYTLSGNLSTNRNEVTSLAGGKPIYTEMSNDPQRAVTITEVGGEIGDFYGYVMEGVFRDQADVDNHAVQPGAAQGDVKFKDLNNDGIINSDDRTIIGSPFPDFVYGFNINLLYKQFDMSVFLQGKQGHKIYNLIWAGLSEGKASGDNNATTEMLNRWTPDNRDTNVPRVVRGDPNDNVRPSTRFLEDGSYLRIQNVQLGYTFNNLSKLRVYVSVTNLSTFTGYRSYNPEVGTLTTGNRSSLARGIDFGEYPIPRTISAGFQINFN